MECLKLYDKEENGTMLLAELEHSLKALGEFLYTLENAKYIGVWNLRRQWTNIPMS